MRRWLCVALLASATLAHAQSKKELVTRLLAAQRPAIEGLARELAERPAIQLMQAAGQAIGQQVPAERREAVGNAVRADIRQYVDEAVPLLRDRALKIAPTAYGSLLEEKFSEAELKQLVAWYESPVQKKYQQALPELQNGFVQKLVGEAGPLLDPKLAALQNRLRERLGTPAPAGAASQPGGK